MSDKYFSIQELAALAGVSVRTIRFYLSEGLLPSPAMRGRYTDYDESYLYRLRLIQKLKDAHLPLREIRRQMQNLSAASVRELAQSEELMVDKLLPTEPEIEPEVRDSAVDYISRVLENQAVFHRLERQPNPTPVAEPPARPQFRKPHQSQLEVRGEQWKRIPLADGLELHVREPMTPEMAERVRRLIVEFQPRFARWEEK